MLGVTWYRTPSSSVCLLPIYTPPYMTQHPLLSLEGWREWGSASGGQRAPPTRVRVLGGQAETAGADLRPQPRPGWRGKGKRCMKGGCIYSPERGQKPNPSFQLGSNWKDSSGRTDVGPRYRWRSPGLVQQGGFPQGPPSRFYFLFWVFRNCRAPPRPHALFGCGKGGSQVLQTWVLQGLNCGPPRLSEP